jgi:hypothetical protein
VVTVEQVGWILMESVMEINTMSTVCTFQPTWIKYKVLRFKQHQFQLMWGPKILGQYMFENTHNFITVIFL